MNHGVNRLYCSVYISGTEFISCHDGVEDGLIDSSGKNGPHRSANWSQLTNRRKPGKTRNTNQDKLY